VGGTKKEKEMTYSLYVPHMGNKKNTWSETTTKLGEKKGNMTHEKFRKCCARETERHSAMRHRARGVARERTWCSCAGISEKVNMRWVERHSGLGQCTGGEKRRSEMQRCVCSHVTAANEGNKVNTNVTVGDRLQKKNGQR